MEMAIHTTGIYPDWWTGRRWDRPIIAWAASDTGETTRDNPQRALLGLLDDLGTGAIPKRLLGPKKTAIGTADLLDYIKIRHASGGYSVIRFKHYSQGRAKWQGPPIDLIWYDEEPPADIYSEGSARLILDTHLGSGSSAIAAHYFGCDFVGCELDAKYYQLTKERFDRETAQVPMFG
jgi:hypothetical protein